MLPPPLLPGSYLVLELTNRCDLSCVHCASSQPHHPHFRRRGDLDPALLDALLDDLARSGVRFDSLVLFWLGEPLVHPQFPAMYRTILRANAASGVFGRIEVHTNAWRLDARNVRVALNSATTPQVWHLTLDAHHPDTWRRIKGRPGLGSVETGITRLIQEKARIRAPWPRLVLQFILSSRNVDEAAPFRHRWETLFAQTGLPFVTAAGQVPPGPENAIFFRQLDCPTAEAQEHENRVFRVATAAMGLEIPPPPSEPEAGMGVCSGFWKSPCISWEGDLTVCTRDSPLDLKIGNLRDASFSDLWFGTEMAERRRRVERADYAALPPCQTCFIPRSTNYTGITAIETRRFRRWEENRGDRP